jgi:hypothetical protein
LRAAGRTVAVVGLVLAAACGVKADVLRLEDTLRPPTDPVGVRLIAKEPAEPYAVIALLSVSSGERGVEALRERLIREAALLGGDAVLLDSESLARTDKRQRISAKVIVFEKDLP